MLTLEVNIVYLIFFIVSRELFSRGIFFVAGKFDT